MSWVRCHLCAHLSWHSSQPPSPLAALCRNYTCRFPQSKWGWFGGVAGASTDLCPGLRAAQLLYLAQLAPSRAITPSQGPVVPVCGPLPKPGSLDPGLCTLTLPLLGRADEPQMDIPRVSPARLHPTATKLSTLHCKPKTCTALCKQ